MPRKRRLASYIDVWGLKLGHAERFSMPRVTVVTAVILRKTGGHCSGGPRQVRVGSALRRDP